MSKSYPYKSIKVAKYIYLRRNTLYAILELSPVLRQKLGKPRLIQSLHTADLNIAKPLADKLIRDWHREIEIAKIENDDAAKYRIQYAKAKASGDIKERLRIELDAVRNIPLPDISNREEFNAAMMDWQDKKKDLEARIRDKHILIDNYIEDWLQQAQYTIRVNDEARSVVGSFCKDNKDVTDFNRLKLQIYVNTMSATLKNTTIRKHLSYLHTFYKYLRRIDVAPHTNHFSELQQPKAERGHKRLPFSKTDIADLMAKSEGTLHQIITLAAYTGCRIEELCSIKIDQVHDKAGVPFFHISGGKTEAATRDVPIHSAIQGTVKILKMASNDGYLISGIREQVRRSASIGAQFSEFKTALGYDDRYVFHSIRKSVATILEDQGVSENIAARILGHQLKTMSYGLYSGGPSLKIKAEALERLSYDE